MANRPCKADADLKRIWQLLLPATPFPACGVQENADADVSESAASSTRDEAALRREFPHTRRDRA
jgi:hypothetical protein